MSRKFHSKGIPGGVRLSSQAAVVDVAATEGELAKLRKQFADIDAVAKRKERAIDKDARDDMYNHFMSIEFQERRLIKEDK
jgi:hypothetical protein